MAGVMLIRSQDPETSSCFPHGCRVSSFGPFSTAFPGHKQGAGSEVELPGLEPVPILDPSAFKVKTLSTKPLCWALTFKFYIVSLYDCLVNKKCSFEIIFRISSSILNFSLLQGEIFLRLNEELHFFRYVLFVYFIGKADLQGE